MFEKSNLTIALNVLYAKKEKVYLAYVSKHNSNREKQVIFLMIPNGEGWHYLDKIEFHILSCDLRFYLLLNRIF